MPSVFYVAPDDPWTRWTNSGVSRAIAEGLRDRGCLGAAMSARDRFGLAPRGRSQLAGRLIDLLGRLPRWKLPRQDAWRDERRGVIGRMIRRSSREDAVLYHYIYPVIDRSLPVRRFLLQDLTVPMAAKVGGFGFSSKSSEEIAEELRRQKSIIQQVEGVISFATFVRDSLNADYGYPAEKVTPIGCGPVLPAPPSINLDAERFRSKRILFVGRAWERKGGPDLLEAFRLLRDRDKDARLVLVSALLPEIDEPGVECHRFVTDEILRGLYSSSAVFCMPSRCETWGLVYCEAARMGTPIVGFREWALPDIVVPGRTGFFARNRTITGLACALEEAISDPVALQRMGTDAVRYVETVLSWEAVLDRLLAAMLPDRVDERVLLPLGRMPD